MPPVRFAQLILTVIAAAAITIAALTGVIGLVGTGGLMLSAAMAVLVLRLLW